MKNRAPIEHYKIQSREMTPKVYQYPVRYQATENDTTQRNDISSIYPSKNSYINIDNHN